MKMYARVVVAALACASCAGSENPADLLISGATVYPAPGSDALPDVDLVVNDGVVAAIMAHGADAVSAHDTLDARGLFLTAGFWNTHVHFTEPVWASPNADRQAALDEMLNRFGFTSVLDTGSDIGSTRRLREAIESGDLRGPTIRTAGTGFVGPGGSPAYLEFSLPELDGAETARERVAALLDQGVDAVKLFTGSYVGPGATAYMPLEAIREAVAVAHVRGIPVVAHPQTHEGTRLAVLGGVDVLVHTAPNEGPWSDSLLAEMVQRSVALAPTLKLWGIELPRYNVPADVVANIESAAVEQVRAFTGRGGVIVFGTDVGYMPDYDPTEEYRLLQRAGLNFDGVLAALTTSPNAVFDAPGSGTVAVGQPADLVLLGGDPAQSIGELASVRYVIKGGSLSFRAR